MGLFVGGLDGEGPDIMPAALEGDIMPAALEGDIMPAGLGLAAAIGEAPLSC